MDEDTESDSNKIFEGYKTSQFSGIRETGIVDILLLSTKVEN
jgi:hypothetical protein